MSDTDALERAYVRVVMAITSRPEMRGYAAAMIAKLADVLEDPRGVPPSQVAEGAEEAYLHLSREGAVMAELAEDGLIRTEGGDLIQNPQSNEGMPHIDGMDRFEVPRVPSEGYLTEGGETMPGRRRSRTLSLLKQVGSNPTVGEVLSHFTDLEDDDVPVGQVASTKTFSPDPSSEGWSTLRRLKRGFVQFRDKAETYCPSLFHNLKSVQRPKVMVISCADSRVSPNMILQAQPGDLFTIRNVANLVPPYDTNPGLGYHGTSAAIEYAVVHLKVEHIVVLGHSGCGGIKALMGADLTTDISSTRYGHDFIQSWVRIAVPARERTMRYCESTDKEEQCRFCEKESVTVSMGNLLTFPFVSEAVDKGRVALHGWYYDMNNLSLATWNMKLSISEVQTI